MQIFMIMMIVFIIAIFIGIPIAYCIGISGLVGLFISGISVEFVAKTVFTGLDSYTFLAIPMFILAGLIMEKGGISNRLIKLATSLVGNVYGGLGIITVIACFFFAAISGSSPATVAAIGAMMIPAMKEEGYDTAFAGALTAASGSMGVLVPPSVTMIIYAITAEVSIRELFLAGFVPGALLTVCLIVTVYIIAKKNNYRSKKVERLSGKDFLKAVWDAKWSMLIPFIILGGIYSGIFTATESAIVAVVYALVISIFVHKELKFSQVPAIVAQAALTTSTVVIILGFAIAFARYLTMAQIPQEFAKEILRLTNNVYVIYLMFIALAFVAGTFMAIEAQILIFTPMFLPILKNLGVDPIHFGIIFIISAQIGFLTPPVGVNLFVAQGISNCSIVDLSKKILPFLAAMTFAQMILLVFPDIVMCLPRLFF